MFPQNFRESVFTLEEIILLKLIVKNGNIKEMADIYMNKFPTLMTPEKEIEISKLKSFYEPQLAGYENKVSQLMEKLEIEEKLKIETPEQEVEIQKLKDEELKLVKQKNNLLQRKIELENLVAKNKENVSETRNVLKEVSDTLKEMEEKEIVKIEEIRGILKPKKEEKQLEESLVVPTPELNKESSKIEESVKTEEEKILKNRELKELLKERGVKIPLNANKKTLYKLLRDSEVKKELDEKPPVLNLEVEQVKSVEDISEQPVNPVPSSENNQELNQNL